MKIIISLFILLLSSIASYGQKKVVSLTEDEKLIYAISINRYDSPCYNSYANVSSRGLISLGNIIRELSDDQKNNYLLDTGEFGFLVGYKDTTSTLNHHFKLKKMKFFLKGDKPMKANCDIYISFSPILYSADSSKAFFISSLSTKTEVVSDSSFFLEKIGDHWKLVKNYAPWIF